MSELKAKALSRKDIRGYCARLRKAYKIGNDPLNVQIFELLCLYIGIKYHIVSDEEFPKNRYAETDMGTGEIRIKESVYQSAEKGVGRHLFTIFHELGHRLMHFDQLSLARDSAKIKTYEEPEWQANTFAGEFLVPHEFIKHLSIEDIISKYGVSRKVATIQWECINK